MRATDRGLGWFVSAGLAGCASHASPPELPTGLRHDVGRTFVDTRVYHGIPILQRSFFWDGNGEVEDSGFGFHIGRYLADGVGLGVGGNVSNWWTSGHDIHSIETEGLLRLHPDPAWPLFVDGTSGFQLADDQVPPGGTVWNFTFGFGCGVELPVDRSASVLAGVFYHHISNALGRENDRNPSQNEARIFLGFGWSF